MLKETLTEIQILKDFLTNLHIGAAYRYLWLVDTESKRKQTIWYRTDDSIDKILSLLERARNTHHIYFGVHGATERSSQSQRLKETDTIIMNAFYADFDLKCETVPHPDDFIDSVFTRRKKNLPRLLPSYLVSSGGGYHAYWLLDNPIVVTDANRLEIKEMQKDWVTRLGADPAACDLARVLRLPLSLNMKYKFKPKCLIKYIARTRYSIKDFEFKLSLSNKANFEAEKVTKLIQAMHTCSMKSIRAILQENVNCDLKTLLEQIRYAQVGTRNTTLNRNAFLAFLKSMSSGQDITTIRNELADAARASGLQEREIESTLNSALRGAMKKHNSFD